MKVTPAQRLIDFVERTPRSDEDKSVDLTPDTVTMAHIGGEIAHRLGGLSPESHLSTKPLPPSAAPSAEAARQRRVAAHAAYFMQRS